MRFGDNDSCLLACILDYNVTRAWLEIFQIEIVIQRVAVAGLARVPVLPPIVGKNLSG